MGDGNEINGLTLGGVGTGTLVSHIEVVSNQDDGIEFFGGTVNTSHVALIFNQDDGFDIDEGHTGTHQFWFCVQNPNSADNGGEWDGVTGGSKGSEDPSVTRSAPQIYNMTLVGPGADSGVTGSDKGNNGFLIDDYFAGKVFNSAIHDFGEALVEVTSDDEGGFDAENNLVGGFGSYTGTNGSVLNTASRPGFALDNPFYEALGTPKQGHTDAETDPMFLEYMRDGSSFLSVLDARPAADSPLLPENGAMISAGAPTEANYQGAFGPGEDGQWLASWSWYDSQGYISGAAASIVITSISQVDADTIAIEWLSSAASTDHVVSSSATLTPTPFAGAVVISGGSLTTDASGAGRVEIDITTSPLFFQVQLP